MTTIQLQCLGWSGPFAAFFAGSVVALTSPVLAQSDYPVNDITIIVPYSPGGGSDQQARRLQSGLEDALGVNLQIVYREGGGGAAGFNALHSSNPDGYTISNVVVPNIIVSAQGDNIGYEPEAFSYIGFTENAPEALVVSQNSDFQSTDDLVAYAEENPGTLTIAGVGSSGRSTFAELVTALGIEATYVPVSGGVGSIIPFLQGGHVDAAAFSSPHVVRNSGTIRALGIAGSDPSPALEGVPTLASEGYEGFEQSAAWGLMAPPGTPEEIIAVLNDALNKTTGEDGVREALVSGGLTPMTQTPEEAAQYVQDAVTGVQRRQALVEELGLE